MKVIVVAKVHGHGQRNVAKVVGATSSKASPVNFNTSLKPIESG